MTIASLASEPVLPRILPPHGDWRRPAIMAGVVLVATFGVFGGWTAMAKLDSAVVASGRIVVDGERKVVQHLEGGIVSEILVADGGRVAAGDILFRIDPTQAQAGADMVSGQLHAALAEEARWVAESTSAAEIVFPDDIPEAIRAGQLTQFADSRAARLAEHQIYAEQIAQVETQIAGFAEQASGARSQLDSYEAELEQLKPLLEKQLAPANRGRALERNVTELEAKLAAFENESVRLRGVISEAKLKDEQVERKAVEAASAKLIAVRALISDLNQRVLVSQDMLKRSEVRAPKAGKVVGLEVHTVGQVVQPGATLLQIVPADESLVVSARLSPLDVTHVHPGLEAEIRLPSFKQRTTPLSMGEVKTVSADVVVDEMTRQSYYEVTISMGTSGFSAEVRDALVAGMPAEVIVATGERTVLDYLVQPLGDALRLGMREQ